MLKLKKRNPRNLRKQPRVATSVATSLFHAFLAWLLRNKNWDTMKSTSLIHSTFLITGATGRLGSCIVEQLLEAGCPPANIFALGYQNCHPMASVKPRSIDLSDFQALSKVVKEFRPQFCFHLGGETSVGGALQDPQRAQQLNVESTRVLHESLQQWGGWLLYASTDMLFDGGEAPYDEAHPPQPLSCYGRTKESAERWLEDKASCAVARLALMFGPSPKPYGKGFESWLEALSAGDEQGLFTDEFRTPISFHRAAQILIALSALRFTGTVNVAGPQSMSRYDLVQQFCNEANIQGARLKPRLREDFPAQEERAKNLSLCTDKLKDVLSGAGLENLAKVSICSEFSSWMNSATRS